MPATARHSDIVHAIRHALARKPATAPEIGRRVHKRLRGRWNPKGLYVALHRMEERGELKADRRGELIVWRRKP